MLLTLLTSISHKSATAAGVEEPEVSRSGPTDVTHVRELDLTVRQLFISLRQAWICRYMYGHE